MARTACPMHRTLAAMLIAIFVASAMPAHAAKPPVRTYHDRLEQLLAYYRATIVEAYRTGGERDEKWNAPAEAALDAAARRLAATGVPNFYRPNDVPSPLDVCKAGQATVDAGCADPMLLAQLAAAYDETGRPDLAMPLIRRAVKGFADFKYADLHVALAMWRMGELTADPDEQAKLQSACRDRLLAACCQKPSVADRRVVMYATWDRLPTRAIQQQFVDQLRDREDADPWVRDNLAGRLHYGLAFDSRGTGLANTVTPQGWKGFHENMVKARDHFQSAWKLDPSLPSSPSDMITVAGYDGRTIGEDPMEWWARALEAQVDHSHAYRGILSVLLPRWGGSYEQMHNVGLACIQNPRYDTLVPWVYVETVKRMGADARQPWAPLSRPEIYANVVKVINGYVAALGADDPRTRYFKTAHAAAAWRSRRAAESRKALEAIIAAGQTPDPLAFQYFDYRDGELTIADVFARTSQHGESLTLAEQDFAAGKYQASLERLKAIVADLDDDDPSRPFFQQALERVKAEVDFAAGDWTPMQFGGFLDNWQVVEGEWSADATGSISGFSKPRGRAKMILWKGNAIRRDAGVSFEVAGKIEFPPNSIPGTIATAGIAIYNRPLHQRGFVLLDHRRQLAGFLFGSGKEQVVQTPIRDGSSFLLRCRDAMLTLEIDGKQVGEPFPLPERFRTGFDIGLGGICGARAKFSDLKLRTLSPTGDDE